MPPNAKSAPGTSAPGTAPAIALIGCGVWGVNIARNLASLGALAAICDDDNTRANSIAGEFGAKVMDTETAITNPGINAVAIATPPASHRQLAIAALEAGKAVFVEKPLALNLPDAEAMANAAKTADRPLMVGHLIRHHPVFAHMLAMVKENTLGTINHIRACRIAPGRVKPDETALYDLACHDLALISALTGNAKPSSITAAGNTDSIIAGLNYKNNLTASIECSWAHPVKQHSLTVIGGKAALVFDDTKPWEQKLALYDDYTAPTEPEYIPVPKGEPPRGEPLKLEMQNFIDAVNGKTEPLTGIDEALFVQNILAQIEASLTTNKGNS